MTRSRPTNAIALALVMAVALMWSQPAMAIKAGLCNFTCNSSNHLPTPVSGTKTEIQLPEFILVFWDDGTGTHPWSGNTPSKTQIIATMQSVMNGPFSAALTQYGGSGWLGRWRMAPYAYTYVGTTPTTHKNFSSFATSNLDEIVNYAISNHYIPGGTPSQWTNYVIVVPNGVTATDCSATGVSIERSLLAA